MLRLVNNFRNLTITKESLSINYTNYQPVRWRKPIWLPVAKTKIFKVPPRTVIPEEEKVELMRLYNSYRTQIKSLRRYLTYKYCTKFLASEDPEEQKKIFEEDFARCIEINKKWNEEQNVLREKRVAEELEVNLDFARNRIELELIKQEEKLQKVEEIVRREKEQGKSFITSENIDEAIEYALHNSVDYNFAIDLNGEKIFGRENNTQEVKQKVSVLANI
ncbi:hypothetical protein NQ314_004320 [Rhamnusium bicolor]|uniref:Small ribosomal subunit protein mS26 n=1 Tax=Rhamnusium bicolor TaxID=1586634 RepID=A0AAV8ZKV8_9CUCU|nr:hypothetical protein NQ314_004320 [Rhamnusium bicolor]